MNKNIESRNGQSHSKLIQKAQKYESISPENIHGWLVDLIPIGTELVLDIGSGSGRDVAWLSERAKKVVAIEPSFEMQNFARNNHLQSNIDWVNDSLPSLNSIRNRQLTFDFIILNSVWSRIPKIERVESFYQIIRLLKPGGYLSLSFRIDDGRTRDGIFPVSLEEIEKLISNYGAELLEKRQFEDQFGRKDIAWVHVLIRSPKIPDNKVPLLHRIIFSDLKNGTHKLGLLRALCHSYLRAENQNYELSGDFVKIPVGLVAYLWVKFYVPLFFAQLPQRSTNLGFENVGFTTNDFKQLVKIRDFDIHIGRYLENDQAANMHNAILSSIFWINKSPRNYIKYANGQRLFKITKNSIRPDLDSLCLNQNYFRSFGELFVPQHIWQSIENFGSFISEDILDEWGRLIRHYGNKQGREFTDSEIEIGLLRK